MNIGKCVNIGSDFPFKKLPYLIIFFTAKYDFVICMFFFFFFSLTGPVTTLEGRRNGLKRKENKQAGILVPTSEYNIKMCLCVSAS